MFKSNTIKENHFETSESKLIKNYDYKKKTVVIFDNVNIYTKEK